ncbi:hypothetical protein B0T11DRAFT_121697 [Plectosphaerella cucumerina]|uniref:F-box domain-containing protein n=1 Tax=Plectosphaerella cucumerina TaxID=40658 RepID=A0A8K0T8M9_9PEZI|nr:hypothetical protein B0T11DRAFT_121697 [Plectosphaerella cucumerina]
MAPTPVLSTHTRPALTPLPTELIAKIIETTPIESRLDIALVCRRLANCAEGLLRRHRDAYEKYRVASDRDPALKAVLFATLPRLRDLKLARSIPSPGGMDLGHLLAPHEPYACLDWLRTFIENRIHQSPQAPGLQGLESLAIGVKTGDEVGDQRSGHLASPKLLIQLLRLPRLLSLYLHRLSQWDGNENCGNYSEWRTRTAASTTRPPAHLSLSTCTWTVLIPSAGKTTYTPWPPSQKR